MVTKDDIRRVRIVAGKEDRKWDVEHITDNPIESTVEKG
jgi:hypothetical protein